MTTQRKLAKNKLDEGFSNRNEDIFRFEATSLQKPVINFLRSNQISLLTGESGTGKDTCCLFRGVESVVKKEYESLVIMKPCIEIGQSLGYLKGELAQKTSPYEKFYQDNLSSMLNKGVYEKIKNKVKFEVSNYLRGNSINYSFILVSEAQNYSLHELMSIVTRVSQSSTIVFNGDLDQQDVRNSGFKDFIKIIQSVDGVGFMNLGSEYQMRNPIITKINREYKRFLENKLRN